MSELGRIRDDNFQSQLRKKTEDNNLTATEFIALYDYIINTASHHAVAGAIWKHSIEEIKQNYFDDEKLKSMNGDQVPFHFMAEIGSYDLFEHAYVYAIGEKSPNEIDFDDNPAYPNGYTSYTYSGIRIYGLTFDGEKISISHDPDHFVFISTKLCRAELGNGQTFNTMRWYIYDRFTDKRAHDEKQILASENNPNKPQASMFQEGEVVHLFEDSSDNFLYKYTVNESTETLTIKLGDFEGTFVMENEKSISTYLAGQEGEPLRLMTKSWPKLSTESSYISYKNQRIEIPENTNTNLISDSGAGFIPDRFNWEWGALAGKTDTGIPVFMEIGGVPLKKFDKGDEEDSFINFYIGDELYRLPGKVSYKKRNLKDEWKISFESTDGLVEVEFTAQPQGNKYQHDKNLFYNYKNIFAEVTDMKITGISDEAINVSGIIALENAFSWKPSFEKTPNTIASGNKLVNKD